MYHYSLSLELATLYLGLLTQPVVAGAAQNLLAHGREGWVDEMQNKTCFY